MSKWYEVKALAYKTFLVEVADDEDENDACDSVSEDFNYDEATISEVGKGDFLEVALKYADEVIYL